MKEFEFELNLNNLLLLAIWNFSSRVKLDVSLVHSSELLVRCQV